MDGMRFRGLVRGELRKLRGQRTTWVLTAALLVLMAALSWFTLQELGPRLQAGDPNHLGRAAGTLLSQLVDVAVGVVLLVAGARLLGGEYSAGTIRVLLGRGVRPLQLLGAKVAALVIAGLVLLAAGVLAGEAELVAFGLTRGVDPAGALVPCLVVVGGSGLASVAACVLLPAAAASLGRSTVFAIAVSVGFFPALEVASLLLQGLATDTYQEGLAQVPGWLLGPVLDVLPEHLSGVSGRLLGFALPVDLAHVLLVAAAWCLGFLVVAVGLTPRRDVIE